MHPAVKLAAPTIIIGGSGAGVVISSSIKKENQKWEFLYLNLRQDTSHQTYHELLGIDSSKLEEFKLDSFKNSCKSLESSFDSLEENKKTQWNSVCTVGDSLKAKFEKFREKYSEFEEKWKNKDPDKKPEAGSSNNDFSKWWKELDTAVAS